MSNYDPQRNRPRARPGDDEPTPVDALLGDAPAGGDASVGAEAAPSDPAAAQIAAPVAVASPAPVVTGEHTHDEHCAHGEAAGPGRIIAAAAAALVGLFALRRWRRRRGNRRS